MTYARWADVLINYESFTRLGVGGGGLSCLEWGMARGGEEKTTFGGSERAAATLDRPLLASTWEVDGAEACE